MKLNKNREIMGEELGIFLIRDRIKTKNKARQ